MVKNKAAMIFGVLIFCAAMFWSLISGIIGLSGSETVPISANVEKGQICEVEVAYAFEIYEVKHTTNLIPTGKEHYYFAETEEDFIPLVIKANTSWYEKNFDDDGFALGTVIVRGKVEKLDYDFVSDFNKINNELSEYGAHISTSLYLASGYKKMYTLRLVSGILLLAAAVVGIVMFVTDRLATKAGGAVVIFGIIAMAFMLFVMIFGETI